MWFSIHGWRTLHVPAAFFILSPLSFFFSPSLFPSSWHQIYALQTGDTDKAFSVLFLYGAWNYFREHTLPAETENESSIINSSVQEPIDRSLILQGQTDNGTRLDPGDISEDEDILTSELVTEELTSLNSTQIAE